LEEWTEEEAKYVNMVGEGIWDSTRNGADKMKTAEGIEQVVEEIA
jgi:hypothetical protein